MYNHVYVSMSCRTRTLPCNLLFIDQYKEPQRVASLSYTISAREKEQNFRKTVSYSSALPLEVAWAPLDAHKLFTTKFTCFSYSLAR